MSPVQKGTAKKRAAKVGAKKRAVKKRPAKKVARKTAAKTPKTESGGGRKRAASKTGTCRITGKGVFHHVTRHWCESEAGAAKYTFA